MARKLRIEFPGAFYHVITRGNNRQRIFADDADYQFFLERLNFYKERFQFILYAYALMPNHVHLLIETDKINLSRIMQALQFTYTQKFNRRHKKVGHLFQGRYKAILCQKESYLLELIRYITQNPVRAKLVKRPIDWRWSSFYDLIRLKDGHVVSAKEVLNIFGKHPVRAVNALQAHVNNGEADHNESYYKLKDQRILGDDDFTDEVLKTGDANVGDFEYYNVKIDDVVKMVASCMDIGENRIKSVTRERLGARARGVVAYICKTMCDKTAKEVGKYFDRSEPVLSEAIKRIESELAEDEGDVGKLTRQISVGIKKSYRPCLVRETK
jgi:REP element-mobilizing transposase RayT